MPSPSLSAHRLASETSLHIFQSQILPAEFPHLPSPSHHGPSRGRPLAVLTVGQTGAGKTRISRAILAAMHVVRRDANVPAHLIADTYKIYHPDYAHLILSAPHLASAATGPDARRWLAMAAEEVVRRAMDVLVESACRHPADFEDLVRIFSEANYRLEVVLLAVPAPLSRLGILVRYYEKLPEAQSGKLPVRLTPQTVHDESYGGLVGAASFLDRSGLADQVIVVRRGNMVAYGVDRAQMDGARIAEALIKERERPLTRDELKTAVADLSRLSKLRDADEQVDLVRHMLSPLTVEGDGKCGDEQRWPELKPLVFGNNRREAEGTYNVLRLGQVEAL
ncbi:uncharacterized protein CPUR_00496 [Claviceps purpurea 20.1]|uniref:Zeta toxin domain-containing protein n=1 Tax=Claviceps purpurea (strain 20.1) TaxID=1111077 RepID=M1W9C4_CLAP2|nr:hypothetical protein E4U38_007641 [Claviceps purpurea]KAG6167828.1 hypothetical protein E4U11_006488 [Claviceps purpurea]KAG6176053.1 hypothetical protein E4U27_005542 [Claviceps purpurea]KAG6281986.1 hypothetical protein E4U48_005518 [Claviceps purpurea]CCE27024.1 uncharacterized protein CPUR_00496 [Claviceps purpurea 20.1]